MSELRPYELQSFEHEARRLIEAARAKAKEILQAALAEKQKVLDQARKEGFETGRAEGREAGALAERQQIASQTVGLQDLLRSIAKSIEEKRSELLSQAERDLVRLSIAIARKIVKVEVECGKAVAAENLRRAVELVARRHELHVLVNPQDLSMIETYLPGLRRDFNDIADIKVSPSDAVSRGGCIVQLAEGSVDADLETQMKEIERGLLG